MKIYGTKVSELPTDPNPSSDDWLISLDKQSMEVKKIQIGSITSPATPPGGDEGQYQWNDGGVFGGDAGFTREGDGIVKVSNRFAVGTDPDEATKILKVFGQDIVGLEGFDIDVSQPLGSSNADLYGIKTTLLNRSYRSGPDSAPTFGIFENYEGKGEFYGLKNVALTKTYGWMDSSQATNYCGVDAHLDVYAQIYSSILVTNLIGFNLESQITATPPGDGIYEPPYAGSIYITNFIGLKVVGTKSNPTWVYLTNSYGIYINTPDASTLCFDIYASDAYARNYFAGSIEFGNTATAIGVVADRVRIYAADYVSGDSRLYLQSELGNRIVIGNNEVQLYNAVGTNYERAFLRWNSNIFKIGTEQGGSGTLRNLEIDGNVTLYGTTSNVRGLRIVLPETGLQYAYGLSIDSTYGATYYLNPMRTGIEISMSDTNVVSSEYKGISLGINANLVNQRAMGSEYSLGIYGDCTDVTAHKATVSIIANVSVAFGIDHYLQVSGTGHTLTSGYGVRINSPTIVNASITNLYGIYVGNQSVTGVSNPNNLYSAGLTSINVFEGLIWQYNVLGTNHERAYLKWDSNIFKIGTEKGGSGTVRDIQFEIGTYGFKLWNYSGTRTLSPLSGQGLDLGTDALDFATAYIYQLMSFNVKGTDAEYFNIRWSGNLLYLQTDQEGSGVKRDILIDAPYVRFGTYTTKGAETFAGFITIKDSGGTERKVMVCA